MKGQNPTAATPEAYLASLDEPRRAELEAIHNFVRKTVPKLAPIMIKGFIGYGLTPYEYASGRKGEWVKIALASNKNYISLYVCAVDEDGKYLAEKNAKRLGKCTTGKSCIRFKRWSDLDHTVVKEVLKKAEKLKFGV